VGADQEDTGPRLRSGSDLGPPWSWPRRGELRELAISSAILASNPLGDPSERPLWVYLPPAYAQNSTECFPTIYVLQGMTGQVDMWRNRVAFRKTALELYDDLLADPSVPPCILVMVDCWTSLGGSQFLDSGGTGRYHSYLCEEVVPAVDAEFRTLPQREHRGVAGKSSGGYGAMVTALLRPDLFSGLASHAGDALFEYCYLPEFPDVVRILRDKYQGSFERFWEDFRSRPGISQPTDGKLINVYCMAACYSAGADGVPELPFDPLSGRMRQPVWERWLAWDPVRMVADRSDAAHSLSAIYLDGGRRDEFFLEVGATAFKAALEEIGVGGVRLDLFDAGHGGIEYRYPIGIRFLAEALRAR
jgi:S-formylglutathione hydrolase FrmB